MALTQCTTNVNVHSALADNPPLTATELKTAWDSAAVGIKEYLNNTLVAELDETIPEVIDNLTSGGTTNALSAEQGKNLNTAIGTKQKAITSGTAAPSGGSDGDIYLRYA